MSKQDTAIAAAKSVSYSIGERAFAHDAAFDDAENGIAWDGEGAITVKSACLSEINIEGSAEILFQGESAIEHIIHSDGGNLALVGDNAAPDAEKPTVIIGSASSGEDPETWGYVASSKHDVNDQGEVVDSTYGDIAVKDLTVVFRSKLNAVEGRDVSIDAGRLVAESAPSVALNIFADGRLAVTGSVIEAGTAFWNDTVGYVGYLYSKGPMIVDGSDVSVRPPEGWADTDGRVSMSVSSAADVKLVGMANGKVKRKDGYSYIDTGDGDSVFLKAAASGC